MWSYSTLTSIKLSIRIGVIQPHPKAHQIWPPQTCCKLHVVTPSKLSIHFLEILCTPKKSPFQAEKLHYQLLKWPVRLEEKHLATSGIVFL